MPIAISPQTKTDLIGRLRYSLTSGTSVQLHSRVHSFHSVYLYYALIILCEKWEINRYTYEFRSKPMKLCMESETFLN